jgi:hypothetical protein
VNADDFPAGTKPAASASGYWRIHVVLTWLVSLAALTMAGCYFLLTGELAIFGLAFGLLTLIAGETARRLR